MSYFLKSVHALLLLLFVHFAFGQHQGLVPNALHELPLGTIKPKGWLEQQLMVMAAGSTGHLDEIHAKIANDNGWLGGKGDGWEETPYWLDGAVPLAYLLNDERLKAKVLRYINWTLDHQRPSGYFGPLTKGERENGIQITADNCGEGEDWWPKMVMLKVLQQYYEASNDKRVVPFMTKYFAYQSKVLDKCPIGKWTEWATSRGAENVMMAQWLFRITGDKSLLELADKIEKQSFPWSTWLGNRDWVMNAAANQTEEKWMTRHAVNVGMALKSPVVNYERTHDQKYVEAIKTGWSDLMLLHGLPMGIFSGDEDLHGNDPTQGVELCAIVEAMFSLEKIIAVTGDIRYMDALERMTFNALPAQTTDDFNMKQYFQIANQVQISRGVFDFSLPFDRGMNNVLGLRSGYTCCTANMHQGWTKFASHLWYAAADTGIVAVQFSPSEVSMNIGSGPVTITEQTDYPFSDMVNFVISTKAPNSFSLTMRIPSWCEEAEIRVNGQVVQKTKGGLLATVKRSWKNGDKVALHLPMKVALSGWAKNSKAVERGPLVYALKVAEKWEKGTDEREGEYFSVFPAGDWNFGLVESSVKNPAGLKVNVRPIAQQFRWNQKNAPVEITAAARKIPGWVAVNGVAHQPVSERGGLYRGEVDQRISDIILIPYGFTKVRVVAFPVVK